MFKLFFTRDGLEAVALDYTEGAEPLTDQADFLYDIGESLQKFDQDIKDKNSEQQE